MINEVNKQGKVRINKNEKNFSGTKNEIKRKRATERRKMDENESTKRIE